VTDGPLIVQSDKTLLLETDHPLADECRRAIAPFAELERAPEHIHTYRLTPNESSTYSFATRATRLPMHYSST
jgi:hypothetical protein